MMTDQTLYLAWQDRHGGHDGKSATRQWFPVGQLDTLSKGKGYRFRYIRGAEEARDKAGFQPLDAFPEMYGDYLSPDLFALFRNRVPSRARRDYGNILKRLGLTSEATPSEILAVSGGRKQTDNLEVFPKIQKNVDGSFTCGFFLHGWRHVSDSARQRLSALEQGDELRIAVELNNPATGVALQLQTSDEYHVIGWAPRYLIADLLQAVSEAPAKLTARVARINPAPAPYNQRYLVDMRGSLPKTVEPMSSPDFQPLVS
ncbi:hypothetical protein [Thioalkalivibrio sp. ALMg9]|uniref:hypothetical protein n=1 Tax=Thioalkalivibrio sp. ALMg9 TaxID=1266912 RepID=UPI000360B636|nr:hypothetical protein [Thioalkalivibrio sp. ALMg9]